MTIEEIALSVIKACETVGVDHMVTGAFAYNYYGIPRSTKDFDVVVDVRGGRAVSEIIKLLEDVIDFGNQVQFDTLTWGRRHIGRAKQGPVFQVELFELFEDAFVIEQFRRRRQLRSAQLQHATWLPTAEDVIVQKIRWGRSKDLDDARDILAVQGPETLDIPYIENWCSTHGTSARLGEIIASLPEL
jgi:hypothetical protein